MLSSEFTKMLCRLEIEYRRARFAGEDIASWDVTELPVLVGQPGAGKTQALLSYLEEKDRGYHFSFRNVSTDLSLKMFTPKYPDIFSECCSWGDFFRQFDEKLGFRLYSSIVFDNVDFRILDRDFLTELRSFLRRHETRNVFVILAGRHAPGEPGFRCIGINTLNALDIKKTYPRYSDEDKMRLLALTEGMPGRLRYYDPEKKLKDGLAEMISDGAAFMKPAETIFRESFRTPESYSALLHGMASGLHRLTDLSEYSGYAYNKCEKYLRAMIDAGFVITQRMDTGDGRTRKGYYLRSSYMMLWAKYFMTGIADSRPEELADELVRCIDREFMPGFLRRMCASWLNDHLWRIYGGWVKFEDRSCYDITIEDVHFDFVQRDGDNMMFIKIWDDMDVIHGADDFAPIEKAVMSVNKFYRSEIILCSVHRFRKDLWEQAQTFRNIHLVEGRFMLGDDMNWDLKQQRPDRLLLCD